MFEEMCKCRALFTKFGGHKLAAGLSLEEKNVERFRRTINELCELTSQDLMPKVSIDMQLPLAYVTEELIEELELLEPFGKGNTKPLFAEKKLKSTESPCDREESECPEISGSGSKWTENGRRSISERYRSVWSICRQKKRYL